MPSKTDESKPETAGKQNNKGFSFKKRAHTKHGGDEIRIEENLPIEDVEAIEKRETIQTKKRIQTSQKDYLNAKKRRVVELRYTLASKKMEEFCENV